MSDDIVESTSHKRKYVSQADVPSVSLERALRVPRELADKSASKPTRPLDVAAALNVTPTSGGFRTLCGAAVGYGLTDGGPNAVQILLTPLGKRVVTPTEVNDDAAALREAALKPSVAQRFYSKYDGASLPPENIARNVLGTFEVPADKTKSVYDLLIENAAFVGFVKTIKDKQYLDLGATGAIVAAAEVAEDGDVAPDVDAVAETDELRPVTPSVARPVDQEPPKNAIFLGHGANRKPMEQLVKILNEYGIPYKQAVEEANRARPIPQKVAEVMRECGAAILVFTADKEYFDKDGRSIWRPSENVSHELGAASVLYGDRIVVFKEAGIELPSNFSSVGYIEFDKDKLGNKGIELFRELVSMKILSISVS